MKLLFEGKNCEAQMKNHGMMTKIMNSKKNVEKLGAEVKLFDKWNDSISDYDIVHIFNISSEDLGVVKYAHSVGLSVVISPVIPTQSKFWSWYYKMVCKYARIHTTEHQMIETTLGYADFIITETETEKETIHKYFNVNYDKIRVIPNGIEQPPADIDNSLIFEKLALNDKYIVQVGRFDENKNQLSVIRAVKDTDMHLVLIGGPDKNSNAYYEKCLSEASNNVHFLGWLNHDDTLFWSALANAHTVILPSKKEIFGNALWEAAACGANVVMTQNLSVEEYGLDKYCLKIDPHNIDDIKNKLMISIDTPKSDKLKSLIKEKFSWDVVSNQLMNVYDECLKNK